MTSEISDFFVAFADHSLATYAPRYDRMTRAAAENADVMALVAAAPPEAHSPNNLQAAAHYLLLRGVDHPLSDAYALSYDGDPGAPFCDLLLSHREEVATLLATRFVQTNEVNRCAAIAPSVNRIARASSSPIALVDVGCSAGLNLLFDRYRIQLGKVTLGPSEARVRLEAEHRGGPIEATSPRIGWRRGVDRRPLDVTDEDQRAWLEALIWPDQPERAERLRGAIDAFLLDPPELVEADAVDGVRGALHDAPSEMLVVFVTTWVVYYFDDDTRRVFESAIVEADRPTSWLAMEMVGVVPDVDVPPPPAEDGYESAITLVEGGAGRPVRRSWLGYSHPHGAWVDLAP